MTTPTIRDYCAAQVNDVTYLLECIRDGSFDPITLQGIADRANTALATPPAPSKEGEGPSDADLYDLAEIFNGDPVPAMRQALEIWGCPTAPPAPEVGEVVAWLEQYRDLLHPVHDSDDIAQFTRAATLLQQQAAPAPAVVPVAVSERPKP